MAVRVPTKNGRPRREEGEDSLVPFIVSVAMVTILFGFLFTRLWYLQIIKGPTFARLSETNRIRKQDILPPRGFIYSADKVLLVENRPSFTLAIVREDVPDMEALIHDLSRLVKLSPKQIEEAITKARGVQPFLPVRIKTDISRQELAVIETYRSRLPGVVILVEPKRAYLHPLLAPHVIGYLGEINPRELKSGRYPHQKLGDFIGRSGVERSFEAFLHGRRGQRVVEVDATGRVVRVINQHPASAGYNVQLTLDSKLQRAAQSAIRGKVGAIVALDPTTGRVLAMASNPTYDPNVFIKGMSAWRWRALTKNPLHPLENRAIQGQYSPGSTFKIVTSLAALDAGVIDRNSVLYCSGAMALGNRVYHCFNRGGHGGIQVRRAIVVSCDVFYYRLGNMLGIDRLARYSRLFGLGQKTGIRLDHEKFGLVPTSAWKKRRFGKPWMKGETLSVAIGQGFNLVTPLQMAQVVAAAANGGKIFRPQLVRRVTGVDGRVIQDFKPELVRRLPFKPEHFDLVRKGLTGVVNEPGGTGGRARIKEFLVGGKTGTAQVVQLWVEQMYGGRNKVPWRFKDHAWFVAFAPADNPKIAVAVVVEHGGFGGAAAAPLARYVIGTYLGLKLPHPVKVVTVGPSWFDPVETRGVVSRPEPGGPDVH